MAEELSLWLWPIDSKLKRYEYKNNWFLFCSHIRA